MVIAYHNYKGNAKMAEFYQNRLQSIFHLRQVDGELEAQKARTCLKKSANVSRPNPEFRDFQHVSMITKKTSFDAHIMDNLISKELRLQESVIEGKSTY